MRNTIVRALGIMIVSIGIAAYADEIQLVGLTDKTIENFTVITNPSAPMSGPTFINVSAYTGLYSAYDVTTGLTWNTFCIDPIGDIKIGDSWNTKLLTAGDLSSGKGVLYADSYGSDFLSTRQKYSMISYIANEYYYTTDLSISSDQRSDVSLAIWEIARDYNSSSGSSSLDLLAGNFQSNSGNNFITSLLADAYANRDGAINISVYSPTERPSQEFLTIKRVPEPSSIGLLLVGLLALSGFAYRRRCKNV
jgi:hypothetical protein